MLFAAFTPPQKAYSALLLGRNDIPLAGVVKFMLFACAIALYIGICRTSQSLFLIKKSYFITIDNKNWGEMTYL